MIRRVLLGLRSFALRGRIEREMQDEMREHLERATEQLMARGLDRGAARREALREFGNVGYLQEEGRIARGTGWVETLVADVRYAVRHFARKPLSTLTILAVLALGIGVNSVMFTVLHTYAVQPPPGIQPSESLVRIRGSQALPPGGRIVRNLSLEELEQYQRLDDQFSWVAGWTTQLAALDPGNGPPPPAVTATFVTDEYFSVLGVRPLLGPGLANAGSEGNQQRVVLEHTLWTRYFRADPGTIGRTVSINDIPFTVVGVAPPRFMGDRWIGQPRVWLPVAARSLLVPETAPQAEIYNAAARLRAGTSHESATAAVAVIAERTAGELEREIAVAVDPSADVVPLLAENRNPQFERDVRTVSVVVGVIGLLILLVTCTNVSGLLTGLALARRREIAVRLSLGASRARIFRQLLTETATLSVAAALGSLAVVWLAAVGIGRLIPTFPIEIVVAWPAVVFTVGIALGVAIVFGGSPALHATRVGIGSALKDSAAALAAGRARLQRALVVAQIGLTQPLAVCVAAALLVIPIAYQRARPNPAGQNIVEMTIGSRALPQPSGPPQSAGPLDEIPDSERMLARLREVPGVVDAIHPPGGRPFDRQRVTEASDGNRAGTDPDPVLLTGNAVSPGYFRLMGFPISLGRELLPEDMQRVPGMPSPAVIGDDLARRLWSGSSPVGQRIEAAGVEGEAARVLEVVGVLDYNAVAMSPDGENEYYVWVPPDTQIVDPNRGFQLSIRTSSAGESMIPSLRGVVLEEFPDRRIVEMRTLASIERAERFWIVVISSALTAAASLALLLSALGLYAVVAFSVGQRRGEIAVRLAIGATPQQVTRLFTSDGVRLSLFGLLLGLPLSVASLGAMLQQMDDFPDVSLGLVTAVAAGGVLLVASGASWIPARRAARVDPAVTLRSE
ncbi:MAG: FtsX-like permease family protein [Gemmatimonas sp.]|nr:FtsX-like permease family protein [Gemmatimonas sp.]